MTDSPAVPVPPATDGPPLPGKTLLGDLLWEVSTYVELMGEAALADTPLTLPSSGMLQVVTEEPGITVAEMSRRMPKTQQAISQVAARLEKLGYLERRLGTGRGVGLHVTETGRQMARESAIREQRTETRLRELLGDDRLEQLKALLGQTRSILREAR